MEEAEEEREPKLKPLPLYASNLGGARLGASARPATSSPVEKVASHQRSFNPRPKTTSSIPTKDGAAGHAAADMLGIKSKRRDVAAMSHNHYLKSPEDSPTSFKEHSPTSRNTLPALPGGSNPKSRSSTTGQTLMQNMQQGPDLTGAAAPERIMAAMQLPHGPSATLASVLVSDSSSEAQVNIPPARPSPLSPLEQYTSQAALRKPSSTGLSGIHGRATERLTAGVPSKSSSSQKIFSADGSLQLGSEQSDEFNSSIGGNRGAFQRGNSKFPAQQWQMESSSSPQKRGSMADGLLTPSAVHVIRGAVQGGGPGSPGGQAFAKSTRPHVKGVFEDLLDATRKTFAAGMGEWSLQSLEWAHPDFKARLLQGPIGPESLRVKHGLSEPDILRLYRVLYLYSVGFCAAVLEPTERARGRDELLESVFSAFTQLWDEALGISFHSEIVDALRTKTDALGTLKLMANDLAAVKAESEELQGRLNRFVRGSIDNMLAFRLAKDKAATTEGEVAMLSCAADVLSTKLAGAEVEKEARILTAEMAVERMAKAEARAQEIEGVVQKVKAALAEQQALSVKHVKQAKDLERRLYDSQRDLKTCEEAKRVVAEQLATVSASTGELKRQLADKSLAYTLLHSDFVVKMHDLDVLRQSSQQLQEQVTEMQETYETATEQIGDACQEAERLQAKLEQNQAQCKDLRATNTKLSSRNVELVRSYWPFMQRVRELEASNAALKLSATQAEQKRAEMEAMVQGLQAKADEGAAARERMETLEREVNMDSQELPEWVMGSMPSESAVQVRAFVRTAKQRVIALTDQLVRLVDVQASSGYKLQLAQAGNRELQRKIQSLENQLQEQNFENTRQRARSMARAASTVKGRAEGGFDVSGKQGVDLAGSGVSLESQGSGATTAVPAGDDVQLSNLKIELEVVRSTARRLELKLKENDAAMALMEEKMQALTQDATRRERWIKAITTQCVTLAKLCNELLDQDPTAPRFFKLPQVPPASDSLTQQGEEEEGNESHKEQGESSSSGDQEGVARVATGRLCTVAQFPSEVDPLLVMLDDGWESLAEVTDRLLEWGTDLVDKRAQLEHVRSLDQRTQEAESRAQAAEETKDRLESLLKTATERADRAEKTVEANTATVESSISTTADLRSAKARLEQEVQSLSEEHSNLMQRHVAMETEYWAIKTKLLDSELATGELTAARERALVERTRMADRLAAAERETSHHRKQRVQLESDVVGLKAWVRTMQETERAYRDALTELVKSQERIDSLTRTNEELQDKVKVLSITAGNQVSNALLTSAEERVSRAEGGAAAARNAAAVATRALHSSEIARLEMTSLLAEVRRNQEATADLLRHSEAEGVQQRKRLEAEKVELAKVRERVASLSKEILHLQLEVRQREAERGMALGQLIDERIAKAAAADEQNFTDSHTEGSSK